MNTNILLLFDVDGTLVESGECIKEEMEILLYSLKEKGYVLGIVGGGKIDKILQQLGKIKCFTYYFSECGSVLHTNKVDNGLLVEIYRKDIRKHALYPQMNQLIKVSLKYLSNVPYNLTGHFIDLRNGLIYISLIGMTANTEERASFLELDKTYHYRKKLLSILEEKAKELNVWNDISIKEGGSVGIAIYPNEFDKVQVLETVKEDYDEIHYFGDKYEPDGNDYSLLSDERVIGYCVDRPEDTMYILEQMI